MSRRVGPLITGEIYHIVDRGIDKRVTFGSDREYKRAMQALKFYRLSSLPVKLSRFLDLSQPQQDAITLDAGKRLVDILAFCLMPNHIHLLLRQICDKGISVLMSKFKNSYTRYFNIKNERDGLLFHDDFKFVRIKSEEQLMHVFRYINLNPYSAGIVKNLSDLENYPWVSFKEYLRPERPSFCERETISSSFKDTDSLREFIFNRADYQRKLERIKHLLLEH